MQHPDPRLMDVRTAAKYLCMSEAALRKNIHLRRFNKALVRIGGRIFLDKHKLDKTIEELSIGGYPNEHKGSK